MKPIKKSDKDKSWIKKRQNRFIEGKMEYHLIICEWTKTEPNYFQSLKEKITKQNKNKITIEIIGKGEGTANLLNYAIKRVQKSTNYISNVWLVFDKDDFTDESFNEVQEKCIEINKYGDTIYNPIWSNESIETWILLHFIKFDVPLSRKDCVKKINQNFNKRKMGEYKKNDKKLYDKLTPYLFIAINNAKWLDSKYKNMLPSEMNPCTKVYKLVEILNKYVE